jgi:GT2 family glycosyltransferase
LVDGLAARPTVGAVGVRQVLPDGQLDPTIRRFSTATRWFFEAIGSERFPFKASWLGERELNMSAYEQDFECDWVSGSFMLVRREALLSAGFMDERFFLFCDENDLCVRIKQAGWEVRHLPDLTILHHAGKAGWNPRLEAQGAYDKRLYMRKHFSPPHRLAATAALALGYGLRCVPLRWERARRECARAALGTLLGRRPPPYGEPPRVALRPE